MIQFQKRIKMKASTTKSFRLEDDLAKKLDKEQNFSQIANQAIREYLNKSVWVPNFEIEKFAGLTPKKLMQRVQNVRYLRSSENELRFILYPSSKDEIERNRAIYRYANGEYNVLHDGFTYFNVKFPLNFYLYLISREWSEVQRAIHGFLCLLYWSDPEKRSLVEEQLEKGTLREVIKLFESPTIKKMDQCYQQWVKSSDPLERAIFSKEYTRTVFELGIDPLLFHYVPTVLSEIQHPLYLSDFLPRDISGLDIKLLTGYMRDIYEAKDDWHSIVVAGSRNNDDLHRAESLHEPWVKWVEEYSFFHHRALKGIRPSKFMKIER